MTDENNPTPPADDERPQRPLPIWAAQIAVLGATAALLVLGVNVPREWWFLAGAWTIPPELYRLGLSKLGGGK